MATKNFKWYAVQVPPQDQESDFDDIMMDGVVICGNKNFTAVGTELLEDYRDKFAEIDDIFDEGVSAEKRNQVFLKKFPHATKDVCERITNLIETGRNTSDEYVCLALQALTGKTYESTSVYGCTQGEWQNIYFPSSEWNESQIQDLGIRYFNNGTSWYCVEASDVHSENPESIYECFGGFYHYSTEWNQEKIQQDLADNVGCAPEELKMFLFAGYCTTPSWCE